MRCVLLILLAAVVLGAPLAVADDAKVGEAAPPWPEASWTLPPEALALDGLKNHVVLLQVWGEHDLARPWPWLDLWQETFWGEGLRVLVLARADADAVHVAARQRAFAYPVASVETLGAYEEPAKAGGTFLVGADGSLLWHGKLPDLDPDVVSDALRKAKPLLLEGSECALAGWTGLAERSAEIGAYGLAVDVYDRIEKAFKGGPEDAAAQEQEKTLKKDKRAKEELAAAKAFLSAAKDWLRVGDNDRKKKALAGKIEKLLAKHDGTRSAAHARFLLGELQGSAALHQIRAFIADQKIDTNGASWRTSLPKPPRLEFEPTRTYFWVLATSEGTIRLKLYTDVAPMHVSSTIYLTELGFYDGLTFHRVIPGFMAQGGCPLGNGGGSPGYAYDGEFSPSVRHDRAGLLSMANSGAGTDGSQFFITFDKQPHLDGKHTIFGEVVAGTDTLKKLEAQGTQGGATKKRLVIEKATIEVE